MNPPEGFLRFSDAVNLLAKGIWGGLRQPAPVQKFKRKYKKASIGFGPWRQEAARRLTMAAINGKVPAYVFGSPQVDTGRPGPEMTLVPKLVLGQLILIRGSLPDHPRVSMKSAGGDGKLYRALNTGLLLVRQREFEAWYRRERSKGRWHSQQSRSRAVQGRPSKQTEALRNAISNIMREGASSIAELRRRLIDSGRNDVPSPDTLGRLVDKLFAETGEREFLRIKRARRNRR
jgi:hypothetical protein